MGDNFEGDLESISAVNTTESVNESQFFDLKKNVPPFLEILLVFMVIVYILEEYLRYRQYKKFKEKEMPEDVKCIVSDEEFEKDQLYNKAKQEMDAIQTYLNTLLQMTILYSGIFVWVWDLCKRIVETVGLDPTDDKLKALCFLYLQTLFHHVISLPFSLYCVFVLEDTFGFKTKTMTIGLFIKDKLKGIFISFLILTPMIWLLLFIIVWGGEYFYIYVWMFLVLFSFIMIIIYPNLIAPCFNKYQNLEDGELKTQIEGLAKRLKFPLKKIFVTDSSKRTSHSNAYMYGFFFSKRIVLFDSLLKDNTNDEILAVLAHELGHWNYLHSLKLMTVNFIHIFVLFFLFGAVKDNPDIFISFGFNQPSTFIGLAIFILMYSPVEYIMQLLLVRASRACERQADQFAKKLGYADSLVKGLIKMHTKNAGNSNPDKWYSLYHYTHPPLIERLRSLGFNPTEEEREKLFQERMKESREKESTLKEEAQHEKQE